MANYKEKLNPRTGEFNLVGKAEGGAGDYVVLDENGLIPESQIPAIIEGRFLSLWDSETGSPISFPLETPYEYKTGDYYIIDNVGITDNYKPDGDEYDGTSSTTIETEDIARGDAYMYDGIGRILQINHGHSDNIVKNTSTGTTSLVETIWIGTKAEKQALSVLDNTTLYITLE